VLVAVIIALIGTAAYYAATVLSYAQLDGDIDVRRDAADPDRVFLHYRPLTRGSVSMRYEDDRQQAERFDHISPAAVGKKQKSQWRIEGLKTNAIIEVTYLDGWTRAAQRLRVPKFIPGTASLPPAHVEPLEPSATGPGGETLLSGQVISAVDRRPIPGALVQISGTRLRTRSDEDGYFHFPGAPPGVQTVEILAPGFDAARFERDVPKGRRSAFRIALAPEGTGTPIGMEAGRMRFVLDWPNGSQDLDAHLEGPSPGGGRFHVDYRHQGDAQTRQYVELHAADHAGGGPETITVGKLRPGTYRYFVHDFTNRNDPRSRELARSGAEVKLYLGDQMYRFAADADRQGNLWDVCTVEVGPEGKLVNKIDSYLAIEPELLGLYDRRTQSNRQVWITNYGGNADSEDAVREGLAWLARHQAPDGFWSSECLADGQWSQCKGGQRCTGPGRKYEMAQTGLTLLAFQAGGHYYFNDRKYSDIVRKALDWMVSRQQSDGALVSEKNRGGHSKYHTFYMYDHGIATFALADACAAARALGQPVDSRYLAACRKAVRYIESQQHEDGGWRYTDDFERFGDASVSGWQVLALKSAKEAGIEIDYRCIEKIRDFFEHVKMGADGRTWYESHGPVQKQQSDATTGIGMLARQFLLDQPDAPMIGRAAAYLAHLAERSEAERVVDERGLDYKLKWNYYTWYNCTLAMFQAGGEPWKRWNDIIRNTIIKLQRHQGCERGSWDPDTQWGDRGGRVYTTALAILTLETYYRYTKHEEIGEQHELVVVSPGEIPQTLVRAEPEPIEFHTRGETLIEELPADELPPIVQLPPSEPAPVVVEPPPVIRPTPPVRPPPAPSHKVGGSKIITVGSAEYGQLEIEAEIEQMDDDTFKLTLRTTRARAEGLAPLVPQHFGFKLTAKDGRTLAVQQTPPAGPVAEDGRQILKGRLVYRLGPRGGLTIHDLSSLTLSYKGHELQHSLRSR